MPHLGGLAGNADRHAAPVGKAVDLDPRRIDGRRACQVVEHVTVELHVVRARVPALRPRGILPVGDEEPFAIGKLLPASASSSPSRARHR
jgi:hypothetical protein